MRRYGEHPQAEPETERLTSGLQSVSKDPVVISLTVALEKAEAENAAMKDTLAEVHALHAPWPVPERPQLCLSEGKPWPCRTIQLLRKVMGDE